MPKPIELTRKEWSTRSARAKKKREKLVLDHAFVVIKIAKTVHRSMTHVDIQDLEQAGFVGLLEAADRYETTKGVFEHYAYFRVRGAMIDAHKRSAYRDETMTSLEQLNFVQNLTGGTSKRELPLIIPIDRAPLPEAAAATREQARLLDEAVAELDIDERRVFMAFVAGVSLIETAANLMRSVPWTRAKLASARSQLGARVSMWGMGLDKAA
jgi:RNA polymerase sigma factor (sigma-70 family)